MLEMLSAAEVIEMVKKALENNPDPELLVDLATVVTGKDFEYEKTNSEFPFMCLVDSDSTNCDDDEVDGPFGEEDDAFDYGIR